MSEERIDAETLAAFLDGKLEAAERDRVLRILAAHPEEYEVFADAAAAAAEVGTPARGVSNTGSVASRPASHRWKRAFMVAVPAALAAGIAAVVVISRLESRVLTPRGLAAGISLGTAAGPGSLAARLGNTWDQPGWSVTRGTGQELEDAARTFRLGARATDVELALSALDTTALRLVGEDLVELLAAMDAGAPAAALYRRVLDRGGGAEHESAAGALDDMVGDSTWFKLGALVEAMRVAGVAGGTEFMRMQRKALGVLMTELAARPSGEVVRLLEELQARLAEPNSEAVNGLLRRIIQAAGR